jgi:uncharacterized protein
MKRLLSTLAAISLITLSLTAQTADTKTKPNFSTHRVVVDLTTILSDGWAQTLSNVEGLKQSFKDGVEIEVVVYGPAVSLLHKNDTDFGARILKLHNAGVHFVVGTSSIEASHATKADMFSFVEYVPSPTAEIVLKQEAGWSYLKGGY